MRIAIISIAKPEEGSGNGTVGYAFALMNGLRRMGNTVDSYYSIGKSKRYDAIGLTKMMMAFPQTMARIARMDYDIIHITFQELGFAAKILKQKGSNAKIVTTIHDLIRLDKRFEKGILEKQYNAFVRKSIEDAIRYSDFMLFNSPQTKDETQRAFGPLKNSKVIWHGTSRRYLNGRRARRKADGIFRVGYVGSFTRNKNVLGMLKTAGFLLKYPSISFIVYGSGAEYQAIAKYRKEHALDNVSINGMAPEQKIVRIYDGFDAFMLPSLSEGFSLMILQAQARCLPVIIFKGSKIPEQIARYCIKADGEKDAAIIIRQMSIHGADKRLLARARAYAMTFTWERTARQTMEVYRGLLG